MIGNEGLLLLSAVAIGVAALAAAVAIQRDRRLRELRPRVARSAAPPHPADDQSTELPARADLVRLTELAGLGIVHVAADGRIASANGAAHRFLERPPGALLGESLIGAFLDHRVEALVGEAVARGAAQMDLVLSGEPQRTLLLRAERDTAGSGAWLLIEDVSEVRRLRRIRTEFVDNLSHELRTPLTTIRVLAELLSSEAERTELPERVRESIVRIDVETGHLVQMVSELLDLARIEHGETPLRREAVDLGRIVEEAIARLRPYAERQDVPVRAEVPDSADQRTVHGDPERLGQLLLNLLHNAIKFSGPGAEVIVRLRSEQATVRLEVEDHGPGIARPDLERIFERFYKVDRARTREGGGTGLGLAIARHVVEGHGGHIWAESQEGRGARFVVDLPAR